MAEKENSAFRLFRFIQKMVPQAPNTQTLQVLVAAFGGVKDSKNARQVNAVIVKSTGLLFSELDALKEEALRAGFSEASLQPVESAFERLSVWGLSQPWQQNVALFQSCLPLLRVFGEGLADEGAPISEQDLNELKNLVLSVRQETQKSDLPEFLKQFVYDQLNVIDRAIYEYPLAGVKAFKAATRDVLFHEAENREPLVEFEKNPVITKLKLLVGKVVKYSDIPITIAKLLDAGDSIGTHVEKAMHAAAPVAHQLTNVIHNMK